MLIRLLFIPGAIVDRDTDGCSPPSADGFTLVELMVTIALLSILMFMGMPTMQSWNGNLEIRNLAQSIQDGLRLAQLEATKRNATVDFVMTNDDLIASPTNATPTASATGVSWVVRQGGTFIQGKSAKIGSSHAAIAANTATYPLPTGFAGVVSFTGFGRTTLDKVLDLRISNPSGNRPLDVLVAPGGKVRMCNWAFPAGDPQACN